MRCFFHNFSILNLVVGGAFFVVSSSSCQQILLFFFRLQIITIMLMMDIFSCVKKENISVICSIKISQSIHKSLASLSLSHSTKTKNSKSKFFSYFTRVLFSFHMALLSFTVCTFVIMKIVNSYTIHNVYYTSRTFYQPA